MAVSQTPMPRFSPENARETYDAMATKEGRKEMLRNHLVEFILPHASHALAMGVNGLFSGNRAKTAGQGGAASIIRNATSTLKSQAAGAAAGSEAALLAAANVAGKTTRDKASAVLQSANVAAGNPNLPGRMMQNVDGGPTAPENVSTTANAATQAAKRVTQSQALRMAPATLQTPQASTVPTGAVLSPEEDEDL